MSSHKDMFVGVLERVSGEGWIGGEGGREKYAKLKKVQLEFEISLSFPIG